MLQVIFGAVAFILVMLEARVPQGFREWAGIGLAVAGLFLWFYSWYYCAKKRAWSLHERPATLVKSGPYRYFKHPLYAGALTFFIGLEIASLDLWVLLLVAALFVVTIARAGIEERNLEKKYGKDWALHSKNKII